MKRKLSAVNYHYTFNKVFPFTFQDIYHDDYTRRTLHVINNPAATNPTYKQVIDFLIEDDTDMLRYQHGLVCCDFAQIIHNKAEDHGMRCGYAVLRYTGDRGYHVINAWKTIDQGLLFTDSTGVEANNVVPGRTSYDRIGYPKPHKTYLAVNIESGMVETRSKAVFGEFNITNVDIHW